MSIWMLIIAQSMSLAAFGADPPAVREAAALTLNVTGRDGMPRSIYDAVRISGLVQPLGNDAVIAVGLYHLRDEHARFPELGAVVHADAQGRFSLEIEPPHAGWKPGQLIVQASTHHFRLLRVAKTLELEVPKAVDKRARLLQQVAPNPPVQDEYARLVLLPEKPAVIEKYMVTANIPVAGRIVAAPPVDTKVSVKLYRVADEARWIPHGCVTMPVRPDGRFSVQLRPPALGWPAGVLRVSVSSEQPRVYKTFDVEMVPRDDLAGHDGSVRPPVNSGVIVDTEDPPVVVPQIPAGAEFAVRGRFQKPGGVPETFGTGPVVNLRRPDGAIAQSASGVAYCEAEGQWWFELPLIAPPKPGQYQLRVGETEIDVMITK